MQVDGDVRAYEAVIRHPRSTELAAITQDILALALAGRQSCAQAETEARADLVARLATELGLGRDDAVTPFGNALDVLGRGPDNAAEGALACALAAHALALHKPADADETARVADDLVWLAAHTPFDATRLLDAALGPDADGIWVALAEIVRRVDQGNAPALGRAEALVAAAALALATGAGAAERAAKLAAEVSDPRLTRVLASVQAAPADQPAFSADSAPATAGEDERPRAFSPLVGEVMPGPRGPLATALLGLTGILLVAHAARLFGRLALAYRKPAELALSDDGGVRVKWRVEILGRVLRDRDVLVPRSGLAQAGREVRFSGVALYAGLLALALGSYVGVSAFVDGVRSASPALLAWGIAIVAVGLGLDFAFSCAVPSARGRCRLLLVPRSGRHLCVGELDTTQADALLARLAGR